MAFQGKQVIAQINGSTIPEAQAVPIDLYGYDGAARRRVVTIPTSIDGQSGNSALWASAFEMLYNGTNWDRKRGNTEGTLLASAARTASVNSADVTIHNACKLAVFLNATVVSGTSPTLDVVVKAKDIVSGKYFTIGTFTQVTAIGSQALFIGSGADTKFATRTIRAECTIGGTTPSFTFSVGYAATVN